LCVKIQSDIGGDDQIKKYNGILQKSVLNTLVEQFKKELSTMSVDLPSFDKVAQYEKRYSQTREVLNYIIAKYLQPTKPAEDTDEPDALGGFEPFSERPGSSDDNDDDDDDFTSRHGGSPQRNLSCSSPHL
jgi:hypothetical protein